MNDIQRVLINITGEQSDGENVEDIAITTEGTFEAIDDGYRIRYSESDEDGNDTTTILSVFEKDGKEYVSLDRSGMITSNLVIAKGERNTSVYQVGPISMTVGVFGEIVKSEFYEQKMSLQMAYTIDINSINTGRNQLTIDVTHI